MSMTQQAKKIEAGRYSYRGYTIYRDEKTQAGYWGSWRVWETSGTMLDGHSLKDCKDQVDRHIDRINAPAKIWEDYCNTVNEYRTANQVARLQNLINRCTQKMVEWPNSRDFYLKSLIDAANTLNDALKLKADAAVNSNQAYQQPTVAKRHGYEIHEYADDRNGYRFWLYRDNELIFRSNVRSMLLEYADYDRGKREQNITN